MFYSLKKLSLIVLFLAVLLPNSRAAESISIRRDNTNNLRIEATSSPDIGYRLQSSLDFQNWTDISDQASGQFSYQVDRSKDTNLFFRLRTWKITDEPIRLAMLGDSTVADYAINSSQFSGWGQGMYEYMEPHVQIINLAISLQSTKSFLVSQQKDSLTRIRPDFVLIAFGRVDAAEEQTFHKTSLAEYEANLKTIVQVVRAFNGTPVLVTPTGPREFDANGKVVPSFEDRCQVVRKVAAETRAYLIDLHTLAENLFNELGPSQSAYISHGQGADNVHFSLEGANVIAGLVVKALPGILQAHAK